jgi:putative transport protein
MNSITILFIIIALGYALGRITVRGVNLGASGIILVALVFGHFGHTMPKDIQNLGLMCFVTAVGYIAGPIFFRNFKKKAFAYIGIGFLVVAAGALLCAATIVLLDIPAALATGLMCGALTSTPGLAAALEASGDAIASVGYGIAYPFGVVGVVLFVQFVPRFLRCDIDEELAALQAFERRETDRIGESRPQIEVDPSGLSVFAIAAFAGAILGNIQVPLPGGTAFSLGLSGGPLLAGLIAGHVGNIGRISLSVPKPTLKTLREFGLVLFLSGAGLSAGNGFVDVLKTYGAGLFFIGVVITTLPMVVGFFAARHLFGLPPFTALGAICGGMTSTPALGSLIAVAGTDLIAAAYAATYPIALICVVIASQVLNVLL